MKKLENWCALLNKSRIVLYTNLNTLVEIFLKVGGIHNAILDGLRAVEDELVLDLLLGSTLSLGRSLLDSTGNHF